MSVNGGWYASVTSATVCTGFVLRKEWDLVGTVTEHYVEIFLY